VSSSRSESDSPVAHEPGESKLIELTMPDLGTAGEAWITSWAARPGEQVALDGAICRIEVEGREMDVCSSAAGTLSRILAEAGAAVGGGHPLAELEVAAEPAPEDPARFPRSPERLRTFGDDVDDIDDVDWSKWRSPAVKLLAEDHGIDLSRVRGTGIGGRIRKRDVLAHIESADRG
jgi:pyruvate/2-oxoglutarate dehydrogenase complex dihydrolipoamide acyltransferase (E2) component